jgi:hypothetical protein
MKAILLIFISIGLLISCQWDRFDQNKAESPSYTLLMDKEIRFPLDSLTGPSPTYIQWLQDRGGNEWFTFFNPRTHSIYYYDYASRNLLQSLRFEKEGPNGIARPAGYHIWNEDSIFMFNLNSNELLLFDGKANLLDRLSLMEDASMQGAQWALKYPQFFPQTVTPIIAKDDALLMTGSYMWAIPDSIIHEFRFTASVNLKDGSIHYRHGYPTSLYGSTYNWDDPFYTTVHYDWNAEKEIMVYSFPIAHDLFYGSLDAQDLNVVPNTRSAKRIQPLTNIDAMEEHIMLSDIYGGIKYDPYRKCYYRLLKGGMPAIPSDGSWQDKPVSILVYDADLHFLASFEIGKLSDWNTENMLLTSEGLLLEYLGAEKEEDEDFLIFRLLEWQGK